MARLCEDMPRMLERSLISGNNVLDYMIPRFLHHLNSPSAVIRQYALACLVPFIITQTDDNPNALFRHMPEFLSSLFKRASDDSLAVRKQVCKAMVALLGAAPQVLLPELEGVVSYILHCTQEEDHELALDACEFWLTFAESQELATYLKPYIARIAPVLLNTSVYEEEELFALGAFDDEQDDAAVPDKAQDIKPRHYEGKTHAQAHEDDPEGLANGAKAAAPEGEDDEEEEDDEDDFSEWTLRKCSAAALDVMAVTFEADLLTVLLPHLRNKLWDQEWTQREAGILVLGAIAEGACDNRHILSDRPPDARTGCIGGLNEHLPTLIGYLVQALQDPKVRAIEP
jgi:transportin-1